MFAENLATLLSFHATQTNSHNAHVAEDFVIYLGKSRASFKISEHLSHHGNIAFSVQIRKRLWSYTGKFAYEICARISCSSVKQTECFLTWKLRSTARWFFLPKSGWPSSVSPNRAVFRICQITYENQRGLSHPSGDTGLSKQDEVVRYIFCYTKSKCPEKSLYAFQTK